MSGNTITIFSTLQKTNIPCAYSHFRTGTTPKTPPYCVYLGGGQNTMIADDTMYWRENFYQVEYYFTQKSESDEAAFENVLIQDGWIFDKSEDVFIDSENLFVIYYTVTRGEKKNG